MNNAEKKWINWMNQQNNEWLWKPSLQKFVIYQEQNFDIINTPVREMAKPEDLIGWQLRFARECVYERQLMTDIYNTLQDNHNNTPTEAFYKAWKRFMKWLEEDLTKQKEA